jgi:ABC-type glycerol-3-phosphate transport system substrate-binding protein
VKLCKEEVTMKRWLLFTMVLLVPVLLVSASGQVEGEAEVVTVKVALEEGRMADVARNVESRFEEMNPGIDVEVIGIPYQSYNEKIQTALSSNTYVYDAFAFLPSAGAAYVKSGYVLPMDEWWDENEEYFQDFLMVDYFSKYRGAPEAVSGEYYAFPFNTDVTMSIYRKDLYEEHGLSVPTTFKEFVEVSRVLNDPENDFYSWGFPGKGGQFESAVVTHLWSKGGQIVDEDYRPTFTTEENVAALEELVKWAPQFAPPGMYETDYAEQNELFASGTVAHIFQWMPAALGTLSDPEVSEVTDALGFAPVPGNGTRAAGWSIGIAAQSKNPAETFRFLKYLMSPEICRESVRKYTNSLVRKSLTEDASLVEEFPWIPATVEALKNGQDFPKIPEGLTIRKIVGEEAIKAFKGQVTAREALQAMQDRTDAILREAGYY